MNTMEKALRTYERYARARDAKGVTDYAVSKEIGAAQSTLSDWKRGRCTPKTERLMKIAAYLGVSIEYFFV